MAKKWYKESLVYLLHILLLAVLVAIASLIGYFFRYIGFPETNIVLVYLLAVLFVACYSKGYVIGILASIIATFTFNYFFTDPYFSFSVYDTSYIITFIIMTITSLIGSALTSRVKQSALAAREKEVETKALYTLTNHLTDARNSRDIAGIAVKVISQCFECQAGCLCFDENGIAENTFIQQCADGRQVRREVIHSQLIKNQVERLQNNYYAGEEFYDWPISGQESILGIIRIPRENAEHMNEVQVRLLHSMIESTAFAMDRFRLAEQRLRSHEETVHERYRGNLLRAISHDLRTPLAGIIGTSEMLLDMTQKSDPRYNLAEGIHKDADWLHALVENILNLTRLQDGRLSINKQLEAVEEIVGGAIAHIAKRSPQYEITVGVPDELLLVSMDAKLIEQVLINLLDNAVKHTPPKNEISISVTEDKASHQAVFSVCDQGKGIAPEHLPIIFQAFYTSRAKLPDAQRGIGLGLTICEAIVKAHGGNIRAQNRVDGIGAEFTFTLPMEENTHE